MADDFNYFPAVTVGGPTGDYAAVCPVLSARWAEFSIVTVANGDGGSASVFATGGSKPIQLLYDGTKKLNGAATDGSGDTSMQGVAVRIASTITQPFDSEAWHRITNSEKKVFVRIDAGNNSSCYVSLRFRVKELTVIPGPSVTVHPDHAHQMNIAREEKTLERLKRMGIPMEIEGGNHA